MLLLENLNLLQFLTPDVQLIREDSDLVSVSNNISTTTPVFDTQSQDIPQTLTPVESPTVQGWKGLKLKMRLGLDSVGKFYQQLVSKEGEAVGIADGEPYWNGYMNQWQVWVNFGSGCRSVVCDWAVVV